MIQRSDIQCLLFNQAGFVFFLVLQRGISRITLPKTNIAPENRPSQKETSIPTIHFQGRNLSFREGTKIGKGELLGNRRLRPNDHQSQISSKSMGYFFSGSTISPYICLSIFRYALKGANSRHDGNLFHRIHI